MSSETSEFHWYTPIAIVAVVLSLLIVGPIVLLPAWFVRRGGARAPVWDPDRYWDVVRGCAVVGSAIYAVLAVRVLLFSGGSLDLSLAHIVQRAVIVAFDFSGPALIARWSAGLLLTGVFALELERSTPRTDRSPIRMLTEAEKQVLAAREAERKRLERERQRREEAEKQRQAKAAEAERARQQAQRAAVTRHVAPAQTATMSPQANTTTSTQGPDTKPPSAEEARNQFVADQAATLRGKTTEQPERPSDPPAPAPPPKPKKPDKGDGSMDDLL